MLLEDLLIPHKTNHSKHDKLITNTASTIEISPSVITMYQNAYYKIKNKTHKAGWLESDIDLLAMNYNFRKYPDLTDWKEVVFDDAKLLLFEMKTTKSLKNEKKGLYQLNRSKNMIKNYTGYQDVDCFMAYNVGTGMVWEYKDI